MSFFKLKMKEIILVLMAVLGCNLVNGGSLLAVQSFGSGYPNFHIIKKNDDGKELYGYMINNF